MRTRMKNIDVRLSDQQRLPYIERYLNNTTKEKISSVNLKLLNEFDEFNQTKQLTINSRFNYLKLLTLVSRKTNKDISKLDRKDITKFIANLRNQNPLSKSYGKQLSKETIWNYQTCLIEFYKYLERNDLAEFIKSIRVKKARNGKLKREDVLTQEEIKLMINTARTLRDKCLIWVLYESCQRLSSIAELRIKDVTFDEYGCKLKLRVGKTEETKGSTAYLIDSSPLLKQYIEQHPYKDDPEMPLWLHSVSQDYRTMDKEAPMSLDGIYTMIKNVSKKSGIKKRIFPHLFRHSRITHLLLQGTPAPLVTQISKHADIQQLNRYGHLVTEDARNFLLKQKGLIEVNESNEKEVLSLKICPRCKFKNSYSNKYCDKCWIPLTQQAILEKDNEEQELKLKLIQFLEVLKEDKNLSVETKEKMRNILS